MRAHRNAFALVDLAQVARNVAEIYGPLAEDSQRSITLDGPAELVVRGDRQLLAIDQPYLDLLNTCHRRLATSSRDGSSSHPALRNATTASTRRVVDSARRDVELQEDVLRVLLDGVLGDEESLSDSAVGSSLGHEGDDLELPVCQRAERVVTSPAPDR